MTKALDTPLVRIVDDDAEQLKSLAFLLRMGGWEVMTYQSAAAFLEMDDPRRSGCLLLDHRMPNMTGMELHETLVERGSLLPVIFLSAHGDIPMAMQAVHRGAMDFLVKPAASEVLLAAVEKAVKKNLADIAAEAGQVDLAQKAALLTERELEVARLVAQGLLNKQIADRLSISLPLNSIAAMRQESWACGRLSQWPRHWRWQGFLPRPTKREVRHDDFPQKARWSGGAVASFCCCLHAFLRSEGFGA